MNTSSGAVDTIATAAMAPLASTASLCRTKMPCWPLPAALEICRPCDVVWDDLLPAIAEAPLADDAEAERTLAAKLASLQLPPQQGKHSAAMAQRVSGAQSGNRLPDSHWSGYVGDQRSG